MRRPNPYANISLEPPPPTVAANFDVPQMNFAVPQMERPDTGGQIAGLGQSLMGLKKRFGGQEAAIAEALKGGMGGGFGGGM